MKIDKSMNIHTSPGKKVKYDLFEDNHVLNQEHADKYLIRNEKYTIKNIFTGYKIHRVEFKEIPNVFFNTTLFSNIPSLIIGNEGPKCPYCKFEFTADEDFYYDEYRYSEETCYYCNKKFKIDVRIETTWWCYPIEEENNV